MRSKSMKHRASGQKGVAGYTRMKRGLSLFLVLGLIFPLVSMLVMPETAQAATSVVVKEQNEAATGVLTSVAFGNGRFVAVGRNRSISTSDDGVKWTVVPRDVSAPTFKTVVFANGKFAGIDGTTTKVYISTDGSDWSAQEVGIVPAKIKVANDRFFIWQSSYVPGSNPPVYDVKLYASQNGVAWSDTKIKHTGSSPIPGMQDITDITYNGSKYIVSALTATFYSSSDLQNWSTNTLTDIVLNQYDSMWPNMNNVIYLKDRFFTYTGATMDGKPKLFTSTDGGSWSTNSSWNNAPFSGGAALNNKYILLGTGKLYVSNDAAPLDFNQWTTIDLTPAVSFDSIAYGNTKYVASSSSGIFVSSDLVKWSNVSANLKSITADTNGNYVAVANNGSYGSIYQSTDASSWKEVTPSQVPGLNAVTYGGNGYVGVTNTVSGGNAKALVSSDSTTWASKDTGIKARLMGVAYGAGLYATVTYTGDIYTSTDGSSWTSRYSNANYRFNTIAFVNNQFIALGTKYESGKASGIVIAKSSNGIDWGTPAEVNKPDTNMTGITYNGSTYVMVGSSTLSAGPGWILKSTDLTNWQDVTSNPIRFNSVQAGSGILVAVGSSGGVFTSVDGDIWIPGGSKLTSNLTSILFEKGSFKVVGDNFSKMIIIPPAVGAQSVQASAATLTPIAGQEDEITLTVLDSEGNTDVNFDGNKNVTVNGVLPAPGGTYGSFHGKELSLSSTIVSVPFSDGVAKAQLKLNRADAQSMVFQVEGVAANKTNALNIVAAPGSAVTMNWLLDITAPAVNGGMFAKQPIIKLQDVYGNIDRNDNSTVVTASKKDAGDWTLTGTLSRKASAGVITFVGLGTANDEAVSGAQLQFKAAAFLDLVSTAVNLPAPVGAQSATAVAQNANPGVGVEQVVTMTVSNALGKTDKNFNGAHDITVSGVGQAPDGSYGSLGGEKLTAPDHTVPVTFTSGIATVKLALNKAAAQSIQFNIANVAVSNTSAISITPVAGTTASMKLSRDITAPSHNGSVFAQQPIIELLDAFGNISVNDNNTDVTASQKDAGEWTLTGVVTVKAKNGLVTFNDLGATNDEGVTGAQLQFKAAGLSDVSSAAVNLPAPAGAQSVTAAANNINPSVGTDVEITLTVLNSLGHTDKTFNGAQDVIVTGYQQAPNQSYGSFKGTDLTASPNTVSVMFVDGVAKANLKLNKSGLQSIVFRIVNVAKQDTNSLDLAWVAGNTASMELTTEIAAPASNGGVFAAQPVITLLDKYGNVNKGDNSTIVTASQKDTGLWTLTGDTAVTAKAGIVTFTNLGTANDAGVTGAQLQFQAAGLTEITSAAVNLPAPAGAQSASAVVEKTNPGVGEETEVTLTVKNSLGHTDTTFEGDQDVTVTGYMQAPAGSYGTFYGTDLTASPNTIRVPFVKGVAEAKLILHKSDPQSIGFRIGNVAAPDTNPLNISPVAGSAVSMKLTSNIAAPVNNGSAFAAQPVITLFDTYGNVSAGDNSTVVTASIKDAGAWKLTGTVTATAQAGIATFSGLGATNEAEVIGAQLAFHAGTMAEVLSAVVDLPWPSLTAPSIESVTAGDGHALLQWSAMYGSVSYAVYQRTDAEVYDKELAVVDSSVTNYDAVGLTNGTTYHFVVKAINPGGISIASNEVSATPQVPVPGAPILQPAVAGDTQIHLEWGPVDGSTGYKVYQSQTSGVYGAEIASVAGAVYSYDVTGLTNGESYYFVVKSTNPGGDSAASNEVSAKPRTVPGAPTDVQATAGNGQATITFKAPTHDGGSSITGYEVTVSPGNTVVAGANSPIIVTGLVNGTTYSFTVQAINSAGKSEASAVSNAVTPSAPTSGGGNNTSYQPSTPSPTDNLVDVIMNGKVIHIGKVTKKQVNGQTVTTVTLDQKKLEEMLAAEGRGAVIVIPVSNSDVAIGEINGQVLQLLEKAGVTLTLQSENGSYTISSKQLGVSRIIDRFGKDVVLQDIKIQIEIAVPSAAVLDKIQSVAGKGGFTLVGTPLHFSVQAFYGSKSVTLSTFDSYVERTILLPDGVDPNRITTAVVIEEDGSVRHVPTKIVRKDGKVAAVIRSLTNSTYAVIWHPTEFKDVAQHWAKDAITDMGSRMVVSGDEKGKFNPDQPITRAEFAAMLVRGLGLKLEQGESVFKDVLASDWYQEAVQTAYANHLINGDPNGQFRPAALITREQAMVMIAQAMKLTGLGVDLPTASAEQVLHAFKDQQQVSDWAAQGIALSVQAGIITGRSATQLAPQATMTRAEVAVIIKRLLQKSNLI
ncbi:S-layer homology domain-containing protein [Paenibacillus guangzhouensis]|uniref:S-layer homology domain-containing protein n=1 Tax=Paenibacillus guangzhouensis TaxID=1473112 RepID=UPI00187B64E9|nr:S-layer homology domain-containing protein [Paenibacillus guangzhouensis]